MSRVVNRCAFCGEVTEKEIDFPLMDGKGGTYKKIVSCMCKCVASERESMKERIRYQDEQNRIDELKRLSLMDKRLSSANFDNYIVTKENEKVFKIAKNYVEKFHDMYKKNHGLLFYGDVGTGKSYTAAAIANELMKRMNTVVMTSFVKMVDASRSSDATYLDRLCSSKLLVIDDLGAERNSDYVLEKVYDIVDSRYRSGKPLILTTNIDLDQMKKCTDIRYSRIYDRIFEMCYPVKFTGLSMRKRNAGAHFSEIKEILEG